MADSNYQGYSLDLSPLLNQIDVVAIDEKWQAEVVINTAIAEYPYMVKDNWRRNGVGLLLNNGSELALSFRTGALVQGMLRDCEYSYGIRVYRFEELCCYGSDIPESEFGLDYVLGEML